VSEHPSFPDDLDSDPGDTLDRLVGISDGIFAFALTLLAVNVDLPQLAANASLAEVTDAVWELAPQLAIYVTSFLLVVVYWQVHRRTFRCIRQSDTQLTWLNLLQLMCVAFLPVAMGLFDTYSTMTPVILLYAGTLAIIGVFGKLLWRHAQRAGLLFDNVSPTLVDYYSFRATITTSIFVLVAVAGILVPEYARFLLLLFVPVSPFMAQLFRLWRRLRQKPGSLNEETKG
jgi:uncharacterized membrane protein